MPPPRQYSDQAEKQRAYRERQAKARLAERAAKGLPAAPPVPTMPSTRRWEALLATALETIEVAREEMQAYYDERTERWQDSDRGADMTAKIAALEEIAIELAEAAAPAERSHMQQAYAARLKEHAAWVDAERGEQPEGR